MKIVQRVESEKELEEQVDDKVTEGYSLESKTSNQAILVKNEFGRAFWHVVIFLLTAWWSLGLGNLVYLSFNYFARKKELIIKIKKK